MFRLLRRFLVFRLFFNRRIVRLPSRSLTPLSITLEATTTLLWFRASHRSQHNGIISPLIPLKEQQIYGR